MKKHGFKRGKDIMNDFTRDELIYLLKCASPEYGIPFETVCEKIQSMIENYQCKHEPENFMLLSNPPQFICKKCGELYR